MKAKLWAYKSSLITITIATFILLTFYSFNFRVNLTGSMPIGLYQLQPNTIIQRGDIVAVCLPVALSNIALTHGYLKPGTCKSGTQPIIKRAIGLPNDKICTTDEATRINQRTYHTPRKARDHKGAPITPINTKAHMILRDTVWLYGDHNVPDSWDSRYFGPINTQCIIGVYRLVIEF